MFDTAVRLSSVGDADRHWMWRVSPVPLAFTAVLEGAGRVRSLVRHQGTSSTTLYLIWWTLILCLQLFVLWTHYRSGRSAAGDSSSGA